MGGFSSLVTGSRVLNDMISLIAIGFTWLIILNGLIEFTGVVANESIKLVCLGIDLLDCIISAVRNLGIPGQVSGKYSSHINPIIKSLLDSISHLVAILWFDKLLGNWTYAL